MKIGYDAKRAFLNNTGLGNYSRWLIKLLATQFPQNTYYLYTPKIRPGKWPDLLRFLNIKTILPKPGMLTSWWRTKGVIKDIKQDGITIYHGLSHELPFGIKNSGAKSVVTIHDLIFMRFPQYFGGISRAIYKLKVAYACKNAGKIIAISNKTGQDLVELLHIDPAKIEVIYQSCDGAFKTTCLEEKKQEAIKKYHLPNEFILSVGTVEERKNLGLLIDALPYINNNIKLVVVGRHTAYATGLKSRLVKLQLTGRVLFLDKVDFSDLPAIYQLASVFVYPSRYEGFGIPILEALNSGIPVIAATGSCLEEAGGPDSLYIGPDDAPGLAEKVNLVLTDKILREKMIAAGKEYSRNFDDEKLAAQIMHLYEKLLTNA